MDLEKYYDKIYRYCYFKVHQREIAEDITQETFLRFLENNRYQMKRENVQYLYVIARNLCIDEYRRKRTVPLEEEMEDGFSDDKMAIQLSVQMVLSELTEEERELLLLRYVNEESVSAISKIYGISRFSVYRKIKQAKESFVNKIGKDGLT